MDLHIRDWPHERLQRVAFTTLILFIASQGSCISANDNTSAVEGFESSKAGEFSQLDTTLGQWHPQEGLTVVKSGYFKSGKQCLQLTGGMKTVVTLNVSVKTGGSSELSFWAERWTVRTPFTFRIEKNSGKGWEEIYNGDRQIRVGRSFLNHVRVSLADSSIRQVRFTCSSPANTGIMLDDIRIAPAWPQEIETVEVVPFSLPVLVGRDSSPLLKLRVQTRGSVSPLSIRSVSGRVLGDSHVESLYVRLRGEQRVKINVPTQSKNFVKWEFPPVQLKEGENIVWIEGALPDDASIDGQIGIQCQQLTFSNDMSTSLNAPATMQRLGVALRQGGDDDAHTYRIPGLATTTVGTLIGVYDVRRRSGGDLPGDIDVGVSRSTDGGQTWHPMEVIMDMGNDPQWRYDGIGDPAVLVDENTGTIWVAATWSHGNRSWRGSGPGLSPEETGQLMLVRSDDDGVTWSDPINITKQVKRPEWCFVLQGPGKGITMQDGTIVFAAQYQDPPENNRLPHSTIIYSKDHGKTWQVGAGAYDDTTESQVVEIKPGVLMLNCRYNRKSARVVMTTSDLGKTWNQHETSQLALIEPRTCMASLINIERELTILKNGKLEDRKLDAVERELYKNWLLFSNPNSLSGRKHITIKASPDNGKTWPKQHQLLLDEHGSAGYSCLSMIDTETVGILYEGSQSQMTFQRIALSDILTHDDADPIEVGQGSETRLKSHHARVTVCN